MKNEKGLTADEIKKKVFALAGKYDVEILMFSTGRFALDMHQLNAGKFLEELRNNKNR